MKRRLLRMCLALALLWGLMAGTDACLSAMARRPLFALRQEVTDCDLYRGLGYTVWQGYGGIVGQEGETLCSRFCWGWPEVPCA